MSEDSERFTRKEKEALLEKLLPQIEKTAGVCIKNTNNDEFTVGREDLIASLTEDAWIRINNPKLDKKQSPEGFVMNGVRWKAQQIANRFYDEKHSEKFIFQETKNRDWFDEGFEGVDEEVEEVDYRDHPVCVELRSFGDKEKAVIYCIEKGIRRPGNIKVMFDRCELNSKGLHSLVRKHSGEKQSWKGVLKRAVRELYEAGITHIAPVRAELDKMNIPYKSETVLSYLRDFEKEKKCQE